MGKADDSFSQKNTSVASDNFTNNDNEDNNKDNENISQNNESKPSAPKKGGMKLSSKKKDENRYY